MHQGPDPDHQAGKECQPDGLAAARIEIQEDAAEAEEHDHGLGSRRPGGQKVHIVGRQKNGGDHAQQGAFQLAAQQVGEKDPGEGREQEGQLGGIQAGAERLENSRQNQHQRRREGIDPALHRGFGKGRHAQFSEPRQIIGGRRIPAFVRHPAGIDQRHGLGQQEQGRKNDD